MDSRSAAPTHFRSRWTMLPRSGAAIRREFRTGVEAPGGGGASSGGASQRRAERFRSVRRTRAFQLQPDATIHRRLFMGTALRPRQTLADRESRRTARDLRRLAMERRLDDRFRPAIHAAILGELRDVNRGTNGTLRPESVTGQSIARESRRSPSGSTRLHSSPRRRPVWRRAPQQHRSARRRAVFDMASPRLFPLKESRVLEFRAQVSNIFNTPQYSYD